MIRCAIYTRKSTDCAATQEMNSLQGQRAVCSAYIRCNTHRGWVELPQLYDDEGYSGKDLDRPALHRLLTDARQGRIDAVLFYKIDRLTRSLADFVRLMDALKYLEVAFVSVTQAFDTSDSMGRMVLNILLTFAQFERELMGDRIRDKKATLKRNGFYVGRTPPIGYDLVKGRLVVDSQEAELVRRLFERFPDYPSACSLLRALEDEGGRRLLSATRRGNLRRTPLHKGSTYRMFTNPIYIGFQSLEGQLCPGEHEPIISRSQWDRVQSVIAARASRSHYADPSCHLLMDYVYDDAGRKLVPRKRGTARHPERYYESAPKSPGRPGYHDKVRVRAVDLEGLTRAVLLALLESPADLRKALVRVGGYAEQLERLASSGTRAASRIRRLSRVDLRCLYESLLARVEVSRSELRVWLALRGLKSYLEWSGLGVFRPTHIDRDHNRESYMVSLDAWLYAPHRDFRLPLGRSEAGLPNRKLIRLLDAADSAQISLMSDPDRKIEEIASLHKMGPSKFCRLIRLSYLAPDIKAAIKDGRHPAELTAHKLLYAPLPSDWQQQRTLLNFASV